MKWKHILRLWYLTKPEKKTLLYLLIFLALFSSIAEVLTLGTIIPFISVLIKPEEIFLNENISKYLIILDINNVELLKKFITFVFIITIIIAASVRLLLVYMINRVGYLIGADMTQLIYSTALSQSYEFHLNSNSSKMINILVSKINASITSTIIPFIHLIASTIITVFIVSTIIFVDPLSSFYIMLALTSLYLFISALTNKILVSNGKIISKEHERVMRLLKDSSNGIREVILTQIQSIFINLYKNSDLKLRKSQAINAFIGASPRFLIEMLAIIVLAIAAYFSTQTLTSDMSSLAYVAMIIFAAQRLLPIMQQIYLSWASIQGAKANVEDMLDFYDGLKKYDERDQEDFKIKFEKSIVLKNVSFKYSKGKEVIKSINLTIKRGQKIGIIGTTGSGKSTILNLLLFLVEPSSGDIFVDGTKLTKLHAKSWQAQISSISQNMFFLDSSIKNNISLNINDKKVSQKKLDHSIEVAQLKNFINNLEDGQDTIIGEDGSRLSGGQRQRIAIARALYREHSILVLDEITSSLDQVTEEKIMNSIYNLNDKTVIVISHRLQSLRGCNKIIKINNGMITKVGTYEEIIGTN